MLVITLGTQASGSTWVFNVVRALARHAAPAAFSLCSGEAADMLDNLRPGTRDLILKAHHLDRRFLSLLPMLDARVIVSTRDARDSVVSQNERFGAPLHEAMKDLTRSFATIAALDADQKRLSLRFEEEFTRTPATVARIADFLGFTVGAAQIDAIFEELRPAAVRRQIGQWLDRLLDREGIPDPVTHWHPRHLGDGQSGKWQERLEPAVQRAVAACLGPLQRADGWRTAPIEWSSRLFSYPDEHDAGEPERLCFSGDEQRLVYGPYLYLPAGRWRATPRIEVAPGDPPVAIRLDVFIPVEGRGMVQLRSAFVPSPDPERLDLIFDHVDHLDPIEFRISSVGDGRSGQARFHGVSLFWLGPSEAPVTQAAAPIGPAPIASD